MGEFVRKTEKAEGLATILLVEDDVGCRSFLRDLLSFDGYGVVVSESASDALRSLSRAIHRPDLLIVDFHMGDMNGFELIRELRSKEDFRAVPILMFSSTHKQIQETVQLEGVQFLSKSSPNQVILETVRRLVPLRATPVRAEVETVALPDDRLIDLSQDLPVERFSDSKEGKPGCFNKFFSGEVEAREPVPAVPPSPPPRPAESFGPAPEIESVPEPPPEPQAAAWTPPEPEARTPAPVPAPRPVLETRSPNGTGSLIDDGARSLTERFARLTEDLSGAGFALRDGEVPREAVEDPHAPAVRLVEELLLEAMRRRASDIHLEPQDGEIMARVRIDGTLHPLVRLPAKLERTLVSRVKILAGMNITERRLPQDGHFSRQDAQGRTFEFRVSTLPSLYGEKIVIRILPVGQLEVQFDSLGFSTRDLEAIRGILRTSSGLVLVTGPTGSGKTTTLYSMLDVLNTPQRNIVTVEDPVEYRLKGITQVQVHSQIGYTFDRVLRHILRQDPNIILIGEIRDAETALIALKASVTGHMVLSTLHTNDAPSTLYRLLSMGMPPYLIAAACRLIVAQRLLRLLCPDCKEPGALSIEETSQLAQSERGPLSRVWRARGCGRCHGLGYRGRRAIFEVMPVLSHEMRQAILDQSSPEKFRELAFSQGMRSLRHEALALAAQGLTSPEEAFSVLLWDAGEQSPDTSSPP